MLPLTLDKTSDKPLYAQLRDAIEAAIAGGRLKPGQRLAPVTTLAKELNVTPTTVRRAYEDLAKAGRIISHVGRGTFVTDGAAPESAPAATTPADECRRTGGTAQDAASTASRSELALAARRLRMGVARSLDALEALAARPGLIRFTIGAPPSDSLRDGVMEELARKALARGQNTLAGYAPPAGAPGLRQAVADRYASAGAKVAPEQVLITSGSQQAVTLLAAAAREDSRRVLCEMPCYMGIARSFGAAGHWVQSVVRDAEGPIPSQLPDGDAARGALLYLCPELHNPMGTDLSPQRRRAVVEWAARHDALLVSDEIFHDLHCDNTNPSSLLAEAGAQAAVSLGSLSKSFAGGLRIGWIVSSAERIRSLVELKRAADIGCPPLMQAMAEELLTGGEYDDHVRRVSRLYQIRRDATLRALKQHMPAGVTWTRPGGGFNMWVELPAGCSSLALFMLAVERGVAISPGPMNDVDHRFANAFRLCYGALRGEQIDEGVRRLAEATALVLQQRGDGGPRALGGLL